MVGEQWLRAMIQDKRMNQLTIKTLILTLKFAHYLNRACPTALMFCRGYGHEVLSLRGACATICNLLKRLPSVYSHFPSKHLVTWSGLILFVVGNNRSFGDTMGSRLRWEMG